MAYQTTTTKTYGQRLSGSFKGIVGGLIMFVIGTIVLFWNEGNFVKTKKALNEAESVLVKVDDVSTLNSDLNGKLIHGVSTVKTDDVLTDEMFDFSANAVKLAREVEYYQWYENVKSESRDKIGGGEETITTYTYEKKWVSEPINSAEFKDPAYQASNKIIVSVQERNKVADNVTWGAYTLPPFIKNAVSNERSATIELSDVTKDAWLKSMNVPKPTVNYEDDYLYSEENKIEYIHASGSTVYFGENPGAPAIGDVRATISYDAPGSDLSVIAQVQGSTFTKFVAKNGKEVSQVQNGVASAEQMFGGAHSANSILTWILRLVGLLLIVWGLKAMFNILPTLFKVLPFLGKIVGAGVGLVCWVFGFAWSLLIFAIAWLFYRPVIAIILLAVAGVGIWFLTKKAKEKKATANN